eukprot:287544-Prorocentrum_minimum.AAC.7
MPLLPVSSLEDLSCYVFTAAAWFGTWWGSHLLSVVRAGIHHVHRAVMPAPRVRPRQRGGETNHCIQTNLRGVFRDREVGVGVGLGVAL